MAQTFRYPRFRAAILPGMTADILEEHVGVDPQELVFPSISTCTGIAAVTAGGMIAGVHLAIGTSAAAADALLAKAAALLQNASPLRILVFGVLDAPPSPPHPTNPGGGWKLASKYAWPTQLQTFRTDLGAPGAEVRVRTQHGGGTFDYRVIASPEGVPTLHTRPGGGGDWRAVSTVRMA